MKVGDLITWRNPRERGKSEFKGYGLVIMAEMMGHLGNQRLWLVVKWSNGKTESVPEWLLASRVKVISESR
jgi:hypothetical protein|tara:strand:- start:634 stop:846 length:213 start_codon:yes stop_codon:yes gene_type:complete